MSIKWKLDIKLPFGILHGKLVDISAVESGMACNCVCPSCGRQLVAKKGDINEHHFAHYNSAECHGAVETALHLYAKEILEKHKRIILPPVYLGNTNQLIFPSEQVTFDNVVLEKKLGDIVPDLFVFIKGKPLLVEIAVTHFVDSFKKARIADLGYSAIEIDAKSLVNYARYTIFSYRDFETLLVEGTQFKRWVNNLKHNLICSEIKKQYISRKVIQKKLYKNPAVEDCPVARRVWLSGPKKGQNYALLDDCWNCPFGEIVSNQKYRNNGMMVTEGKVREVRCSGHRQEEIEALAARFKTVKTVCSSNQAAI